MQIFICQSLALILTALAYVYEPWNLIYAIAMAHYFGSVFLISPLKKYGRLSLSAKLFALASPLIALALFIYAKQPIYFVILFGIHHLFTEYYLDAPGSDHDLKFKSWRQLRNVLVTLLILFIGAVDFGLQRIWLALPIFVVLLKMLTQVLAEDFSIEKKKYALLETVFWAFTMTLAALVPDWLVQDFIFVSLYHFIFWFLFPIVQKPKSLLGYLQIPLMTVFFLVIALWPSYKLEFWQEQFLFWAYFHIIVSLVSSELNPRWVQQWTEPHLKT